MGVFQKEKPGNVDFTTFLFVLYISDQQFVHILGCMLLGKLTGPLWEWPTENVDISFFTFPWHIGQLTSLLTFMIILSNVYEQVSHLNSYNGICHLHFWIFGQHKPSFNTLQVGKGLVTPVPWHSQEILLLMPGKIKNREKHRRGDS